MPPHKRPRDESLHDDDDDVEASQSHNRNHQVDSHDDDNDDDNDDDDFTHRRQRDNTPPRTQYEILRDKDFEHLQHEELDDRMATQQVLSRPARSGPNNAADNGIIESVTCINFMCHTKLHVELGPLINFVVGENGSGKSAVLTAITLCLGAKASSTNRGGSLKTFIKEGQEASIIRVQLKNQGTGAYQHEVFGDSIVVERHFNKSGTSGFRLKNGTGSRTVSTKRQAIDEVVEHFCLQVDNPLNVLSQDNARQFLNSASPAMKYKYFVQGVQLEALDHDYKLVEEILENIEAKLKTHEGHLNRLKVEADKAHNLASIVREHEQLRQTLREMRVRLVWSQVVDVEKEVAQMQDKVEVQTGKIRQLQGSLGATRSEIDNLLDRVRKLKEDREVVANEAEAFSGEVEIMEEQYRGIKAEVAQLHSEERNARTNWAGAKEEIEAVKSQIKQEQKRLSAVTGDARQVKQQELDQAKDAYDAKKRDAQELRNSRPDILHKMEESRRGIRDAERNVTTKTQQIRGIDDEILKLRHHNGNFLDAYPPNVKRLLDAIEREQGWKQKPIGPIGRLIALKRPEWSSIIEKFLGQTPQGFIVTQKFDMDRLKQLMDTCQVKNCPIIKTFPQTLDLSGKEPSPEFDTILRVLEFDNIKVRDILIINHSIEQTVLIKNRKRAEDVLFSGHSTNIAAILSFHDHASKRGTGLMLSSRNNNHSTTPIDRFNGAPRLRSDADAQLKDRYEIRGHLDSELKQLQSEYQTLKEAFQQHQIELQGLERRIRQDESAQRAVTNRISDLEAEIDQFDGSDHKLQLLNQRLEEAERSEKHNGGQFGALRVKFDEVKAQMDAVALRVRVKREEKKEYETRVKKVDMRISNTNDALRVAQTSKQEIERRIGIYDQELANLTEQYEAKKANCEDMERMARDVYPERVEMEEGETFAVLNAKFGALRSQLQSVMDRLGDTAEAICQREAETMERYQKTKDLMEELVTMQKLMRESLADRIERWRYFQRHLSARTRVNFSYLLSERGFRGKMIIDHRSKVLALQVEPDEHRKIGKGRSTNTLSGGEKSFSSVCMLLSIWEAMGSSIRCLDEFDVFMDNVNRAISTNMLITAARRSVSRQYILITPNAIESRAELGKDVMIIRLTDPRQRQITQMM